MSTVLDTVEGASTTPERFGDDDVASHIGSGDSNALTVQHPNSTIDASGAEHEQPIGLAPSVSPNMFTDASERYSKYETIGKSAQGIYDQVAPILDFRKELERMNSPNRPEDVINTVAIGDEEGLEGLYHNAQSYLALETPPDVERAIEGLRLMEQSSNHKAIIEGGESMIESNLKTYTGTQLFTPSSADTLAHTGSASHDRPERQVPCSILIKHKPRAKPTLAEQLIEYGRTGSHLGQPISAQGILTSLTDNSQAQFSTACAKIIGYAIKADLVETLRSTAKSLDDCSGWDEGNPEVLLTRYMKEDQPSQLAEILHRVDNQGGHLLKLDPDKLESVARETLDLAGKIRRAKRQAGTTGLSSVENI
ncbi:hypothetical protein I302_102732 [Kwoniella bestiolae CBS 10118]|uniref:Uncharacterized protein n=1 Tax=Kwoniella bestiolae CBS 10118 TaxID=1296100 RepID=A0AAJ8K450_9TREE